MVEFKQGLFKPKHPDKYVGDPTNIIYRSSWEERVLKWLDNTPNIIAYASEELAIPYFDPSSQKRRRYFPDFVVQAKKHDGSVMTIMLEVKPFNQVRKPEMKKKASKRFIAESLTWMTNISKWNSAMKYCDERGWTFAILTKDKAERFYLIEDTKLRKLS